MKIDIKDEKLAIRLIFIGIAIFAICCLSFLWNDFKFNLTNKIDTNKVADLGNLISGLVGSIWALAGVLLFYVALVEQRKDIKINHDALFLQVEALNQQIKEFELQRNELESSRKIYEEQSKTLRLQQFESSFYSLFNVYLSIKNTLNSNVTSKDCFKNIYDNVIYNYDLKDDIVSGHNKLVEKYSDIFNSDYKGGLSSYFKIFYRILKVIDLSVNLNSEEKVFYSKIVRSQLAEYEQLVLWYNSHSVYGEKERYLLLRYKILKNIPYFEKPVFKFYYNRQGNNDIIYFASWLTDFFDKYIDKLTDIACDSDVFEEQGKGFRCIVCLSYNADIDVKVYCDEEIINNGIKLTNDEFLGFLKEFIFEIFVFSKYALVNEFLVVTNHIIDEAKNNVFSFVLKKV